MRVYIDVNVALDLLLNRLPFSREAEQIMTLAHQRTIKAGISATAFPFAFFHLNKHVRDAEVTKATLKKFSTLVRLVAIDEEVVLTALEDHSTADLEDGVQLAAARAFQADAIVTRDQKAFRAAEVPVFSPPAFLEYWVNLQP
jgi:predicted nucleic acid-binding protein